MRIIDEGLEGTGYEESWAETVTAGNTLDENSVIPGTPPIGAGSQCLKAIFVAGAAFAYALQIKTNQNINYVRNYLYMSEEGLNNNQIVNQMQLLDSAGLAASSIQFIQTAGALNLRFQYYSGGASQNTAEVGVSLNTWYRVEYKYDVTNMLWEWELDGVSQASGALSAATKTPNRMRIGGSSNGSAQSTVYNDLAVWDNTNWVGEEPIPLVWQQMLNNPYPHKREVVNY